MSPNQVAPQSLGTPSIMGRKRTKNHGLPPRMQQKGSAYYYVIRNNWQPLGSDLPRAKRKWADLESGPEHSVSVGDLVQKHIDRKPRPASTLIQYRSYQKTLADAFPISASQLRSPLVAVWRELQARRKTYANGAIAVLIAACRYGHELGLCEVITVGKWELEDRDRDLLADEFRAIRDKGRNWLQDAMDIGYFIASRPCDLRALKWDHVTATHVLIRQEKTKKRQAFPINDDLTAIFARIRQRPIVGLYVLANAKGRPISKDTFGREWRRARGKADVPEDTQFRDIRALSAKDAENDGLDIQKLLGHSTRAQSERYLKGKRTITAQPNKRRL